ncbi:MAG: hypothetical protein LUQ45_03625, partial [Methanoregulaceae archaeon]|nr:hypothetical protein [Methanoregulaceae archaeon]
MTPPTRTGPGFNDTIGRELVFIVIIYSPESHVLLMTCLSVLGVGKIGGEVAFLATVLGIADELILYDAYAPTLKAQLLDLKHSGIDIPISTDTRAVKSSDICVFSAGLPRNPTIKTRADLLEINLPAAQECSRALLGF